MDTLLQFEETLTTQQVVEVLNKLLEQAFQIGAEETEKQLRVVLRQYPTCIALQFNASALYTSLQMMFPSAEEEDKNRWQEERRKLLEVVRASGCAAYWQSATVQLAGLKISDGALEEGEALLRELPESTVDSTFVWTQYYLKQNQLDRAREQLQKRLFKLVSEVEANLLALTNPQLLPETERQLRACTAYRAVAQTFGLVDMADGVEMGIRIRMGKTEAAAACFARYVDAVTGPAVQPNPALFSPALDTTRAEGRRATTPELRRWIARSITEESQYQTLRAHPTFVAAWERLQASL